MVDKINYRLWKWLACEQQTHFRSSLPSLRKIGAREATTGCSQARKWRDGGGTIFFPFVAREFVRNFIVNGRHKLSIFLLKNTNQFQYLFSKKRKIGIAITFIRGDYHYHLCNGFKKKYRLKNNVNKRQTVITVKLPSAWTSQYDKISHQHDKLYLFPPKK